MMQCLYFCVCLFLEYREVFDKADYLNLCLVYGDRDPWMGKVEKLRAFLQTQWRVRPTKQKIPSFAMFLFCVKITVGRVS